MRAYTFCALAALLPVFSATSAPLYAETQALTPVFGSPSYNTLKTSYKTVSLVSRTEHAITATEINDRPLTTSTEMVEVTSPSKSSNPSPTSDPCVGSSCKPQAKAGGTRMRLEVFALYFGTPFAIFAFCIILIVLVGYRKKMWNGLKACVSPKPTSKGTGGPKAMELSALPRSKSPLSAPEYRASTKMSPFMTSGSHEELALPQPAVTKQPDIKCWDLETGTYSTTEDFPQWHHGVPHTVARSRSLTRSLTRPHSNIEQDQGLTHSTNELQPPCQSYAYSENHLIHELELEQSNKLEPVHPLGYI